MLKAWKRPNQVICCFRPPMKCSFLSVQVDIRYPILKPLNMSLMRAVVGSIQSIPSEFDSCGCFFCLILIIIYNYISPYIYILQSLYSCGYNLFSPPLPCPGWGIPGRPNHYRFGARPECVPSSTAMHTRPYVLCIIEYI
jgi:hypothetical protein